MIGRLTYIVCTKETNARESEQNAMVFVFVVSCLLVNLLRYKIYTQRNRRLRMFAIDLYVFGLLHITALSHHSFDDGPDRNILCFKKHKTKKTENKTDDKRNSRRNISIAFNALLRYMHARYIYE